MRVRTLELNQGQRNKLETGHKEGKTARFRQRCQIILLKSQGRTAKSIGEIGEIGEIVGLSAVSVTQWLNRYDAEEIAGLQTRPGRGRPRVFNEARDAQVVKAAVQAERQRLAHAKQSLEDQLGKRFSTQTLKRFLKHLAAHGNASGGAPNNSPILNSPRSV